MALKGLYRIPLTNPFLKEFAIGLLNQLESSPMALANHLVILPTQRSIRDLKKIMIDSWREPSLILPRMIALGSLSEEELGLTGMSEDFPLSPMRRQAKLAHLILTFSKQEGRPLTTPQAFRLATDLMALIDQVILEDLNFEDLKTLVDGEYAKHWEITLQFLTIATDHWPRILSELNLIEPAQARKEAILSLLKEWKDAPPNSPVILAGSTGSMKLTRQLMKGILELSHGCVVLPGFQPSETEIAVLNPIHPQHTLATTVKELGVSSNAVTLWPFSKIECPSRENLFTQAFKPDLNRPSDSLDFSNIHKIETSSEQEEALVNAFIIREALDDPLQTILLITPDRALARRVAACLQRWDIIVNDSAGQPLSDTSPGILLRLICEVMINPRDPIAFLSLLKHPLVRCGVSVKEMRTLAREVEIRDLRGHPDFSLETVEKEAVPEGQKIILTHLENTLRPLQSLGNQSFLKLETFLEILIQVVHSLSQDETGAILFHQGEEGKEARAFLTTLLDMAADFSDASPRDILSLITLLMRDRPVRFSQNTHPRVSILGLLEARLLTANTVILAGLNEGTWPMEPETGAWLSRPMREEFGLQPLEQRIGLSAHDFTRAFAAETVYLTRSMKVSGVPALPCRWLLRLEALLQNTPSEKEWTERASFYISWARKIDGPDHFISLLPPQPTPPIEKRPRVLSVTQVELWMRDPYSLYARHILNLKKLPSLIEEPTAADRGSLIHACLERYKKEGRTTLEDLIAIGEELFTSYNYAPFVKQFWLPRFQGAAKWFVMQDQASEIEETLTETKGLMPLLDGSFTLTAKADRIDRLPTGDIRLIDYKTGALPSDKIIESGYACQLPLEGLILKKGGFSITPTSSFSLQFWSLKGKEEGGEVRSLKEVDSLIDAAEKGLISLIQAFEDYQTPYRFQPRAKGVSVSSDYDHLARVQEWRPG